MTGFGYTVLGFGSPGSAGTVTEPGQAAFTSQGSFTWVAPDDVTSVCVVAIGGGKTHATGGAGGGLGWKNDIAVTPSSSYTVVVGAETNVATGPSYFIDTDTVKGGQAGGDGGDHVGDGGGDGGNDGQAAGGGAGGYSGDGGAAGTSGTDAGSAGEGGGGGGGGAGTYYGTANGGTGGGTGILGEGDSGAGGAGGAFPLAGNNEGGGGGSGGGDGDWGSSVTGGLWGGGGGVWNAYVPGVGYIQYILAAAPGAVRIIWGAGRAFPSTSTADV